MISNVKDEFRARYDSASYIKLVFDTSHGEYNDNVTPGINHWSFSEDTEYERMNFLAGMCDFLVCVSPHYTHEDFEIPLSMCPRARTFLALRDEIVKSGKCSYKTYRENIKQK